MTGGDWGIGGRLSVACGFSIADGLYIQRIPTTELQHTDRAMQPIQTPHVKRPTTSTMSPQTNIPESLLGPGRDR